MTDDGVYRLEGGEQTYDELFSAVTVAEAKAEEDEAAVTVYRKLLQTFEPVVKVHPDGKQERLD